MSSPAEERQEATRPVELPTDVVMNRRQLTKWCWLLQETGFSRRESTHLIMARLLYQAGHLEG
jgi:hypothetical protein